MTAFIEALTPRFEVFGQVVVIGAILRPLTFAVVPFISGLVASRQRLLGLTLFAMVGLMVALFMMSETWPLYAHPRGRIPFDVYLFSKPFLWSAPAFVLGIFAPAICARLGRSA